MSFLFWWKKTRAKINVESRINSAGRNTCEMPPGLSRASSKYGLAVVTWVAPVQLLRLHRTSKLSVLETLF